MSYPGLRCILEAMLASVPCVATPLTIKIISLTTSTAKFPSDVATGSPMTPGALLSFYCRWLLAAFGVFVCLYDELVCIKKGTYPEKVCLQRILGMDGGPILEKLVVTTD